MRASLIFIVVSCLISGCVSSDSLQVAPKESFDMLQIEKDSVSLLHVITCGDYVYYPFGFNEKHAAPVLQALKQFSDSIVNYPYADTVLEFHSLRYRSSRLLLFFDDNPEAQVSSYILKGEVLDESLPFTNNVHIGMTIESFLSQFFARFPARWPTNLDTIVFESCVVGIRHIYTFSRHRLVQIEFQPVGWDLRL